jgi:hypothetical protein
MQPVEKVFTFDCKVYKPNKPDVIRNEKYTWGGQSEHVARKNVLTNLHNAKFFCKSMIVTQKS